jgi:hypothetical protein
MRDETKLGFLQLGRRFEDPVELFSAAAIAWALVVILFAVAVVLDTWMWLGLIVLGVAILYLKRARVAELARRWHRERIELEQRLERRDDDGLPQPH